MTTDEYITVYLLFVLSSFLLIIIAAAYDYFKFSIKLNDWDLWEWGSVFAMIFIPPLAYICIGKYLLEQYHLSRRDK